MWPRKCFPHCQWSSVRRQTDVVHVRVLLYGPPRPSHTLICGSDASFRHLPLAGSVPLACGDSHCTYRDSDLTHVGGGLALSWPECTFALASHPLTTTLASSHFWALVYCFPSGWWEKSEWGQGSGCNDHNSLGAIPCVAPLAGIFSLTCFTGWGLSRWSLWGIVGDVWPLSCCSCIKQAGAIKCTGYRLKRYNFSMLRRIRIITVKLKIGPGHILFYICSLALIMCLSLPKTVVVILLCRWCVLEPLNAGDAMKE